MVNVNINIEDVIGHFVKAEVELTGYFEKVLETLEGRIIYRKWRKPPMALA